MPQIDFKMTKARLAGRAFGAACRSWLYHTTNQRFSIIFNGLTVGFLVARVWS